jgi:pyrimidine-nucleoside phosphorylase
MRAVEIIIKKRDGGELSQAEIEYFVEGYASGDIPDYQASAWAMAVVLRGMSTRETTDLALAMAHSGEVLDLSSAVQVAVDKHSTGGVGDKTTLVVEPVVAACGLPVGKMSGRGLGFTGGTLDKLESIPGFRTDLSTAEFLAQLRNIGLVLTGQTADLAPADGKLYSLRDVTGTVQSIPLIASSVMCKKIASGAQAIVLDVKLGNGAFMQDLDEARHLSELMVSIAHLAGRKAVALLSDMNQPLGFAVGNALELKEAIETLHGGGPQDFRKHCLVVAGHMLAIGGVASDAEAGIMLAEQQLASRSGYLSGIHAREVGETAVFLGAGREKKGEPIDHAVGVVIHRKVGEWVEEGQPLFTVHASQPDQLAQAVQRLLAAHTWSDEPVQPLPLFYGVIRQILQ